MNSKVKSNGSQQNNKKDGKLYHHQTSSLSSSSFNETQSTIKQLQCKLYEPSYVKLNQVFKLILLITMTCIMFSFMTNKPLAVVEAKVLMRVCDTREIKTVTSRVCMLYKRTKNSDVKLDKLGNVRMSREIKGDYSPAKLATECCKVGCPPHIFAYNC